MRIALITDGISPYVLGGMQKHSFYLVKYFAKHKIFVDLIHYNNSNYDINKLEFFTPSEKEYINSIILQFPTSIKFPGHYVFNSYKYSCLAFDAIKPNLLNYDFIYTKGFTGWKLITEKNKGNIACCKIGVKFHGYEMFQIAPNFKTKLQHYLLRPFVKKISKNADVVFSYGGKITNIIKSIGVNPSQIIEIPSGVELDFISKSISYNNKPYVKFVFLGRAERRKGIEELNKSIKKLLDEKQEFEFDFIGPIPDDMKIHHKNIFYYGEIRDVSKIKTILSQNDILVCASWSEGFPNVILEAMACGLAIIATDVGAVSALVSSKNGWLISPASISELSNSLALAIQTTDLQSKKENSLQLVTKIFNWDSISIQTIKSIFN